MFEDQREIFARYDTAGIAVGKVQVSSAIRVPFGDLEAMARAISPSTVALMVEPVQGEGGVVVPPDGRSRWWSPSALPTCWGCSC